MPAVEKVLTLLALGAVFGFAYYSLNSTPVISDSNFTYIAELEWYKTYEEGLREAKQQNRTLMVYFWTIWCIYCEKYHTEVFSRPDINAILAERFVRVAVDMDVNKRDTRRFGVQAPPYIVFLTPDERVIMRVPGYVPADEFRRILDAVVEEGDA